ncbi:MAG: hypothetical protein PVSMB4_11030 [Ktedonobacterales bacterium]
MALVAHDKGANVPLRTQADLLSLSRASLYDYPRRPSAEEVALKHRIDAIYTQYAFYCSRRITAQLRQEGKEVNRKAVQRHMREMGIAGIRPGPNLSRRAHGVHVYPYLLRGLRCAHPNQVWGMEEVYPNAYATPREARQGPTRDLTLYSDERPHQALAYRKPAKVYMGSSA